MSIARIMGSIAASATLVLSVSAHGESLAEALVNAYVDNPNLRSARAQLRSVDERLVQAGAPYRLNLEVNASSRWSREQVEVAKEVFVPRRSDGAQVVLSASQLLYNGGRTASQVSAAEAEVLAAREELRQSENGILLEVVDSYASVLRDQEIVRIREAALAAFGRQVEASQARRDGGDLTLTDTSQAQAQFAIAQTSLEEAKLELQNSRARFATVVGHNPQTLEPVQSFPLLPEKIEDAFAQAKLTNPSIQRAAMLEQVASYRVASERAESMPQVSASGDFGYRGPPSFESKDYGTTWDVGVNFRLPLMQGGLVQSRVRQAKALREQASFDTAAVERDVYRQVQGAWNQAVAAVLQQKAGQNAVDAAAISSDGSKKEYREGLRSTFEVLNEEQRYLDAQIVLEQARYRHIVAQAQLLAFMGSLEIDKITLGVTPPKVERPSSINGSVLLQPISQALDQIGRPSRKFKSRTEKAKVESPSLRNAPVNDPAEYSQNLPLPVYATCDKPTC